jgi:ADP-ribose pyrophosphatase YjhB (NUDIX family)
VPKLDYFHDPSAPVANSIVVAASAFVQDDARRVLMIQRSDNGLWAIPGGAQDLGESIVDTTIREVREETGLSIEVVGLVGIYSDPGHVIAYDDGEVRQEFSVCFRARPVGGTLATSTESKRAEWIEPEQLGQLDIHPSVRLRIEHGLVGRDQPYFG